MENFEEPSTPDKTSNLPLNSNLLKAPVLWHWLSISSWAMFFSILLFLGAMALLLFGYLTLRVASDDHFGVVLFICLSQQHFLSQGCCFGFFSQN
ncbi:MAG: hypothetical protein IPH31_16935 [Lewinellaceae bacterium]|nr:hypothetical protein [Lewinellaceae bacterium]